MKSAFLLSRLQEIRVEVFFFDKEVNGRGELFLERFLDSALVATERFPRAGRASAICPVTLNKPPITNPLATAETPPLPEFQPPFVRKGPFQTQSIMLD